MLRIGILGLLLLTSAATAQTVSGTSVPAEDATQRVETYFNTLTTYQAAFAQKTDGEAWTQEGTFSLNRPKGQFLWDYTSPDRQRLIATGTHLYFVDGERGNSVTELPVKSGLSRLFTGKQLNLAKEGLRVTHAHQTPTLLSVIMEAMPTPGGSEMGGLRTVTLHFQTSPMALASAEVTDETDATTRMTFSDIAQGVSLNEKMFHFTPRLKQM